MAAHRIVKWKLMLFSIGTFILIIVGLLRIAPESSPAARGATMTGIYSCLECHGKIDDASLNDWSISCKKSLSDDSVHPLYDVQCEDLLAFFAVVQIGNSFSQRISTNPSNRLLAGEQLARKFYCFQCHGELGQGGYPNSGAMKGYIPGYFGNDFRELTNNASPEAVRTWILQSTNPQLLDRFIDGPIAAYFLQHQSIQMPKFNSLSDFDLQLLVDYVIALHEFGPMNVATLRRYDALTRQ